MKRRSRILSLLLAGLLAFGSLDLQVFAEEAGGQNQQETKTEEQSTDDSQVASGSQSTDDVNGQQIIIKSQDDWNTLAKNCRDNTYSLGKTVILDTDLTLGKDMEMIPYFAGNFQGNNHKITVDVIKRAESDQALFCQTGSEAVIADLSVEFDLIAKEDQENIGGIVGTNRGTIEGCTYYGILSGQKNVGGIAAVNDTSGQILDSTSGGVIIGENKTGGTCGYNQGIIYACSNAAAVNVSVKDEKLGMSSIEESFYKVWKDQSLEDLMPSSSDTGGICGYSTGIINQCSNSGSIGYDHVGYNVGGIAGRQCGYVGNSENTGNIKGRKDVGGIVGQAVPDITIVYGEDTITNLRNELKTLQNLMKQTTSDADRASKKVTSRLNQVSDYVDVATDSADKIYDQVDDNVKTNEDTINDTSAKTKTYIRRMREVSKTLSVASKQMDSAQSKLNDWYNDYKEQIKNLGEDTTTLDTQVQEANDAIDAYQAEADRIAGLADNTPSWGANSWDDIDWDDVQSLIDRMNDVLDILEKAYQDDRLSDALDEIDSASKNASDAVDSADGIIDDLDNEDEVSIKKFDESFDSETDRLHGALTGISDQLSLLNSEMSGESDTLIRDMDSVSDQFTVLMDLFIDALADVQDFDVDDLYEDASDEEIASTVQGKVTGCNNHGLIEGDVNTGGVVGTMAIEYADDPEDDLDESRENKLHRTYQTKVIVENCFNDAEVAGKKNCVGAVVGRMDLGVITHCYGDGLVHSSTGDYVGGVCGYALSGIRSSASKSILAGKDYVGGITGIAEKVNDCESLVTIVSHERYSGAIAGSAADLEKVTNNRFTSDILAGVDRVSYAGSAESLSYDQLLAVSQKPEFFQTYTLTFRLDKRTEKAGDTEQANKDQTVVEVRQVSYGDSISQEDYPSVKAKKGYYVVWDQPEVTIDGNRIISGSYVAYNALLESSERSEDGRPQVLVEGHFTDEDSLGLENILPQIEDSNTDIAAEAGAFLSGIRYRDYAVAWKITLPDDGMKKHTVRLRIGDTDKKYGVFVKQDGEWKEVDATTEGHHILVTIRGTEAQIAVMEKRF